MSVDVYAYMRASRLLIRHGIGMVRAGQLRFRLETFGVYYPAAPYERPWWQVSMHGLHQLARQSLSYARWVIEMEMLRERGAGAWWEERGGSPGQPPVD